METGADLLAEAAGEPWLEACTGWLPAHLPHCRYELVQLRVDWPLNNGQRLRVVLFDYGPGPYFWFSQEPGEFRFWPWRGWWPTCCKTRKLIYFTTNGGADQPLPHEAGDGVSPAVTTV